LLQEVDHVHGRQDAMTLRQGTMERRQVAHHEAGHAVAALVTGWPIQYATLAPRRSDGVVGLVRPARHARRLTRSGNWMPELVVLASGMAAEDIYQGGQESERRPMARRNARYDLRGMRTLCRHLWHWANDPGYDGRAGGPDPSVVRLDTPIKLGGTVHDIAADVWARSVRLVWERWPAVREVADHLDASRRALTQAELRRIVQAAPLASHGDDIGLGGPLAVEHLEFWPARYSRLVWRPFPPSACRPRTRGRQHVREEGR
jgi:hypothetical protein